MRKTLKKYKLDSGKELKISNVVGTSLYGVSFTSGGQLPERLSGLYTDYNTAEKEVIAYLESKVSSVSNQQNGAAKNK